MTTYYTYRPTPGPGQQVQFTAGKGYYLVDTASTVATPAPAGSGGAADKAADAAGAAFYAAEGPNPVPFQPTGDGGSGVGGGGGSASSTDWASLFWGSLGLDAGTIAGLNKALAGITDATQAQLVGMNYLQTTSWFKQTFPSYADGVRAGLFTDLNGYRDYVNKLNVLSQQYNGRPIGTDEVAALIAGGLDPSIYEKQLTGAAYINANKGDIQYETGAFGDTGQLTPDQLKAYGQDQAGLVSPLGEQVKAQIDKAVQRMHTIFQGSLARPAGLTVGQQGLNAAGLLGTKQPSAVSGQSDIAAL